MSPVLITTDQLRRRPPGGIGTYVEGLLYGLGQIGFHFEPYSGGRLPIKVSSMLSEISVFESFGRRQVRGLHMTSPYLPRVRAELVTSTVHDLAWQIVPEAFSARGRRWHENMLNRQLAMSHVVFAVSAKTKDVLLTEGVHEKRIRVINLGVDHIKQTLPENATTQSHLASELSQLGIPNEYLLSVGTLEPRKNLSRLLVAHEYACTQSSNVAPLVVVGPRGWGGEVASVQSKTYPKEQVSFVGEVSVSALAVLYSRARALIFPSLYEGFGLPVVEALGQSCPVICGSIPSAGAGCLVVDQLSIAELTSAIIAISNDNQLRASLVAEGLARTAEMTWMNCAKSHVEAWGELGIDNQGSSYG